MIYVLYDTCSCRIVISMQGGLRAGVLTSIGRDQAYMAGRRLRTKLLTDYAVLSEQYDGNDI